MTNTDFWKELKKGGKTVKDYEFEVVPDGRLRIQSPKAAKEFFISADKVDEYFEKLSKGMNPTDFSSKHSAWFRNVYDEIIK